MSRLRLKINLIHDERNQDADVAQIERRIENVIRKAIEDVRIAVGREAGAVFVLFEPDVRLSSKLNGFSPEKIADRVVEWLENDRYAENVRIENWIVEPYEGDSA